MNTMQPSPAICSIPDALISRVVLRLEEQTQFDPATNCIFFTGSLTAKGYGRLYFSEGGTRIQMRVHRAAWILANGPISDATLVVDHLCRRRSCVNPRHLDLVTPEENRRRGNRPWTSNAFHDTHCRNGHPWDAGNRGRESGGNPHGRPASIQYCKTCQHLGLL